MFNQSAPQASTESVGIHAILIEKNVGMSELWLPTTIEGKYTFPNAENNISIIADGAKWKACVANGGYFAFVMGPELYGPFAADRKAKKLAEELSAEIGDDVSKRRAPLA